tara:strand:+ start:350 stop:574 length:225 start_codon:yes stop_codon:yes gene_type:complete
MVKTLMLHLLELGMQEIKDKKVNQEIWDQQGLKVIKGLLGLQELKGQQVLPGRQDLLDQQGQVELKVIKDKKEK